MKVQIVGDGVRTVEQYRDEHLGNEAIKESLRPESPKLIDLPGIIQKQEVDPFAHQRRIGSALMEQGSFPTIVVVTMVVLFGGLFSIKWFLAHLSFEITLTSMITIAIGAGLTIQLVRLQKRQQAERFPNNKEEVK